MIGTFEDIGQDPVLDADVPGRRMSASARVCQALRAQIVSLALLPGTRLSRPQLAEAFGLSQTPRARRQLEA